MTRLPVLAAEPPVVLGEVLGSVDETSLLALLASGAATPDDTVGEFVGEQLGLIGVTQSIDSARVAFE